MTPSARLRADGVTRRRADDLALLVLSAFEGALVVARAARDVEPLERVHAQLTALIRAELPAAGKKARR